MSESTDFRATDPIQRFLYKHVATTIMDWRFIPSALARAIKENPQEHIDALVEAGVLHKHRASRGTKQADRIWYNTNPAVYPHKHDWRIVQVWGDDKICLRCEGCHKRADVAQEPRGQKPKWEGKEP